MKTYISDTFPLKELECQYFEVCRHYDPKVCRYDSPCPTRQILRKLIEPYESRVCLELQIELIMDEHNEKEK